MAVSKRDRNALIVLVIVVLAVSGLASIATGSVAMLMIALVFVFIVVPIGVAALYAVTLSFVALHEFGHYLGARAVGMTFVGMRIGPLVIGSRAHGRRFRRGAAWVSNSGFCLMAPKGGELRVRDFVWMILGGPIASLLGLVAILALGRVFDVWHVPGAGGLTWTQSAFGLLTFIALSVVFGSVVPYQMRGQPTDALMLIHLRDKSRALDLAKSALINSMMLAGARARDWDLKLIEPWARAARGEANMIHRNAVLFYALWDRGDRRRALEHATLGAAACSKPVFQESVRKLMLYEHAFALAIVRSDPLAADGELARADAVDSGKLDAARNRAVAAVRLARADYAGATEAAEAAVRAIRADHKVVTPGIQAEIEWCQAVRGAAEYLSKRGAPPADAS